MNEISRTDAIKAYKLLLEEMVSRCPRGIKQEIATKLGTNRSFVSQVLNPEYAVPLPARHVSALLETCRASPDERAAFQAAFDRAHEGRNRKVVTPASDCLQIPIPRFKKDATRREVSRVISDSADAIIRLAQKCE